MPDIDWGAVPAGVWGAIVAALGGLLGLLLSSRLSNATELRRRQEAADVQREVDDHNDLLTFRRELQEENSRRLVEVRALEARVREREKEVHNLRVQLLAEQQVHGSRIAELERKLDAAERALAVCQGALASIQTRRTED